jgi:hypothetical protein
MFLFITDIEQEGVGKNSIKSISVEYEEYMNLISCK